MGAVKQENTGHGAIQINGNHNTVNYHHNSHHHQHVHAHAEAPPIALQAPPAPPASSTKRPRPAYDLSTAQKDVLALMRPLPKHLRVNVLDFKRAEFGTGLVVELAPRELQRVRKVVQDARRAAGV